MRPQVGAKSVAGQDVVADRQQVALAFVDVASLARLVALRRQPGGVGRRLLLALSVFEARDGSYTVDDQPAIGGVHHVGQAGNRIDEVDAVPQLPVNVVQVLPLSQRTRRRRPESRCPSTG